MSFDPSKRVMNTLRIRLPGATDGLLTLELFNTLDELFRDTDWWREPLTVTLNESTRQYPLVPPAGAEIVRVIGVRLNDRALPAAAASNGDVILRGRINADTIGTDTLGFDPTSVVDDASGVFAYSLFQPDYITISGQAQGTDIGAPLNVVASLTLDQSALDQTPDDWGIPEFFWKRLFAAMLDGTLGRMMSQIAKPWASERMAIYHLKRSNNLKSQLRVEADRGPVKDVPTWNFPQNF